MKFEAIDNLQPLSYKTIRNTLYEWRRSGTDSSNFNSLDGPGHLFFKIIFHFFNGDAHGMGDGLESGLLTPSWRWDDTSSDSDVANNNKNKSLSEQVEYASEQTAESITDRDTIDKLVAKIMDKQNACDDNNEVQLSDFPSADNSAYNYLVRNDELERAEKLKQFIILLSNISTYSPWYFSEISGLDALMERPFKHGEEYYKYEPPKQLTIKCMPDGMDQRIATLLDLYRDVAYSHINHREVLPANLRRFDMSIYIFDSPISNLHFDGKTAGSLSGKNDSEFPVSFKRIELHDCEIDYNATKAGYAGLNNAEGFQQVFEIPITVGNTVESRYNQYLDRSIGDLVATDLFKETYSHKGKIDKIYVDTPQKTRPEVISALYSRLEKYEGGSVNLMKTVDDLTGNYISSVKNSILLGNIYKLSLSDITTNAKRLAQSLQNGNVGGVINSVKNTTKQVKNGWSVKSLGSITHTNTSVYTR